MIKRVFFTAALLVPGLACAGNPSADLTVQISPTGSVATPPAGAQAAGFTTLAADFDFSNTTMCIGSSCVPASPLSNWLDCAGATGSAIQWHNQANCRSLVLTTDSGINVLDLNFHIADFPTYNAAAMQTANASNSTAFFEFPTGTYVEIKGRAPSSMLTSTCNTAQKPFNNCPLMDLFGWSTAGGCGFSCNNPFIEWDFIETYANKADGSTAYARGSAGFSDKGGLVQVGSVSGYDPTVYNIYGQLITTDGAGNWARCSFLNNAWTGKCDTGTFSPSTLNKDFLALEAGPYTSGVNYLQDGHYYIQWIRVWECSSWAGGGDGGGGQCNTNLITNP
jgi:hypothetical protein